MKSIPSVRLAEMVDRVQLDELGASKVLEHEVCSQAYGEAAKEVLRLVGYFEALFSRHGLYCDSSVVVDALTFRWRTAHKGFEYCRDGGQWLAVRNVFDMEVAAVLLESIGDVYLSARSEQERVTAVLESAAETGNAFADMLSEKE